MKAAQIKAGKVDLDDPATTLALLKLDAVVGVTVKFDKAGRLQSMGIQCAFCHSSVMTHSHLASANASTAGPTGTPHAKMGYVR